MIRKGTYHLIAHDWRVPNSACKTIFDGNVIDILQKNIVSYQTIFLKETAFIPNCLLCLKTCILQK